MPCTWVASDGRSLHVGAAMARENARHQLRAIGHSETLEQTHKVIAHGVRADSARLGDLAVRMAAQEQHAERLLARRQSLRKGGSFRHRLGGLLPRCKPDV